MNSSHDPSGIGAGTIVRRKPDGAYECVADNVSVEEPLEIRLGKKTLAITMRTPGNDEELAAGFLLTEASIRSAADLSALAPSGRNVINVSLAAGRKVALKSLERRGSISSSCGVCGKTSIAAIHRHFPPIEFAPARLPIATLLEMPERLRDAQENFDRTGGIHAAALFDLASDQMIVREDIGRHNAVDKVIGQALLDDRLPLTNHVLMVSGRSSFEIVQKALAARIAIVASVSAPSSLAINFARESNQTLIGFLRPPTFNIYSHVERVML